MMERTLSIIKPDGVSRNLIGTVIKRLEEEGLKILAMKMINESSYSSSTSRADDYYNNKKRIDPHPKYSIVNDNSMLITDPSDQSTGQRLL